MGFMRGLTLFEKISTTNSKHDFELVKPDVHDTKLFESPKLFVKKRVVFV